VANVLRGGEPHLTCVRLCSTGLQLAPRRKVNNDEGRTPRPKHWQVPENPSEHPRYGTREDPAPMGGW